MQTKFKRHQLVRLLVTPDPEYVEYHNEEGDNLGEDVFSKIEKGMLGKINILLSNGKYHVEILDKDGKTIAYAPMSEEDLEEVD